MSKNKILPIFLCKIVIKELIYYKFSSAAGENPKKIFLDSKAVFYLVLALPIGEYMFRRAKKDTGTV